MHMMESLRRPSLGTNLGSLMWPGAQTGLEIGANFCNSYCVQIEKCDHFSFQSAVGFSK